jgi:hypothetical protein
MVRAAAELELIAAAGQRYRVFPDRALPLRRPPGLLAPADILQVEPGQVDGP